MNDFDEETEAMLVQSAEDFAEASHDFTRVRALREAEPGFDRQVWAEMGELGWTGILLPESAGGSGLPFAAALALAEIFGKRLIPEPFVSAAVVGATILAASSQPAASAAAQRLAQGEAIPTLAFQESPGQLDISLAAARIVPCEKGFRMTARKVFVPAWADDGTVLITASDADGTVIAMVEAATIADHITARRMSDGTFSADIDLAEFLIPQDSIIMQGAEAEAALKLAYARGVIATCAQLCGVAESLLSMTGEYVAQRVQFGQPLAARQALRHRLVDLKAQIELASSSWRGAAVSLENGSPAALWKVSIAKARCSDAATEMGRAAIQYHGAFGYTEEADIGLYVNASLRLASYLGNAARHRQRALDLHIAARNADG